MSRVCSLVFCAPSVCTDGSRTSACRPWIVSAVICCIILQKSIRYFSVYIYKHCVQYNISLRRLEVGTPEDALSNPNIDISIGGSFGIFKQRILAIRPSNCTDVQIVYFRYNKCHLYNRDCVSTERILRRAQQYEIIGIIKDKVSSINATKRHKDNLCTLSNTASI